MNKRISGLFNGKESLNSAELNDLYFPISDEQRADLQICLLDMYDDILKVSKEHGFTPFLVGGSALGAVRHKGFIPWDDDLDIGFVREEYESFLQLFEKEYENKYVVNAPGKQERTRARFAKILKKGTVFREMISLPEEDLNGIFVDVFPIDNVPDNKFVRRIKGLRCDMLAYISSQVFNRENRTPEMITAFKRTGRMNYYVRMTIGFIFSFRKSSSWFKAFDKATKCHKNDSRYCTIAAGRKHYFGEILKRDMVWPPRCVSFENGEAPVFNDVEGYLSQMYGDFMKIPSADKRERHYLSELKM